MPSSSPVVKTDKPKRTSILRSGVSESPSPVKSVPTRIYCTCTAPDCDCTDLPPSKTNLEDTSIPPTPTTRRSSNDTKQNSHEPARDKIRSITLPELSIQKSTPIGETSKFNNVYCSGEIEAQEVLNRVNVVAIFNASSSISSCTTKAYSLSIFSPSLFFFANRFSFFWKVIQIFLNFFIFSMF